MLYVIFWGLHKDKSPIWEADITLHDEEPTDPKNEKVIKFNSESHANDFLDINYHLEPRNAEVVDMETAEAIHEEYLSKVN